MASITTTTTKTGERRYRVRYRDPGGNTREKWFKRKVDAGRFAATVEADKLRGQRIGDAEDEKAVAMNLQMKAQ